MDAKKSAEIVLEQVWQRGFPVDAVWIANQLSINVKLALLSEDISGAIIKKKDENPIIVLNKKDIGTRMRFSCAHELGHFIYRVQNNMSEYEYVDLRSLESSQGNVPEEVFANKFAANLLMPEAEIKQLFKSDYPSFLMAGYFGVSIDAMSYRLKNLGY